MLDQPDLEFQVFGTPAPQGSKRAFYNPKLKRSLLVEDSSRVRPWRESVKHAALDAMDLIGDDFERLDGPLALGIDFVAQRPRSHYRTGRNSHLLRDTAPTWKASSPDLSKLIRSTEDAITDAGAWLDDRLVAQMLVTDRWGEVSGAHVRIWRLLG